MESLAVTKEYLAPLFVLAVVVLGAAIFTIATLVEVLHQPEGMKFQSGSKATWVVAILLTGIFGAILFRLAGRPRDARTQTKWEFHVVMEDDSGASSKFSCRDCDFETDDIASARKHRLASREVVDFRGGLLGWKSP